MRRVLLLLAIAVMMLDLTAAPAFAKIDLNDIPPPGPGTPGNPQSPDVQPENFPTNPTADVPQANNLIGASQRKSAAGPGTLNPGSAAKPTDFGGPAFNGPVTSTIGTLPLTEQLIEELGLNPNTTKPNVISAFQEATRCGLVPDLPSCPAA